MQFNTNESLIIGINDNDDLVVAELNFNDLNKGTKFYNPYYYISLNGLNNIKDAETGREEARERLSESEYWEDIGFLSDNIPDVLKNNIDFNAVADDVINSDGWEMTNGEYYYFGIYGDENYYLNLQWCGFKEENNKKEDYKKLFISDDDFNFLMKVKEIKEENKQDVAEIKKIFSKYQDTQKIIKTLLE